MIFRLLFSLFLLSPFSLLYSDLKIPGSELTLLQYSDKTLSKSELKERIAEIEQSDTLLGQDKSDYLFYAKQTLYRLHDIERFQKEEELYRKGMESVSQESRAVIEKKLTLLSEQQDQYNELSDSDLDLSYQEIKQKIDEDKALLDNFLAESSFRKLRKIELAVDSGRLRTKIQLLDKELSFQEDEDLTQYILEIKRQYLISTIKSYKARIASYQAELENFNKTQDLLSEQLDLAKAYFEKSLAAFKELMQERLRRKMRKIEELKERLTRFNQWPSEIVKEVSKQNYQFFSFGS